MYTAPRINTGLMDSDTTISKFQHSVHTGGTPSPRQSTNMQQTTNTQQSYGGYSTINGTASVPQQQYQPPQMSGHNRAAQPYTTAEQYLHTKGGMFGTEYVGVCVCVSHNKQQHSQSLPNPSANRNRCKPGHAGSSTRRGRDAS
jgi:hypothetical protein